MYPHHCVPQVPPKPPSPGLVVAGISCRCVAAKVDDANLWASHRRLHTARTEQLDQRRSPSEIDGQRFRKTLQKLCKWRRLPLRLAELSPAEEDDAVFQRAGVHDVPVFLPSPSCDGKRLKDQREKRFVGRAARRPSDCLMVGHALKVPRGHDEWVGDRCSRCSARPDGGPVKQAQPRAARSLRDAGAHQGQRGRACAVAHIQTCAARARHDCFDSRVYSGRVCAMPRSGSSGQTRSRDRARRDPSFALARGQPAGADLAA